MSFSAIEVANYIINFSHEHGDCISNLKLQKLLYYAQAWSLALLDKPLFDDRIEAWVHGPVVPNVYRQFKNYTWNPITENPKKPDFPNEIEDHLINVMDYYGKYSAYELEKLTHNADPWKNARGDIPLDESSNAVITHDSMRKYYNKLATQS